MRKYLKYIVYSVVLFWACEDPYKDSIFTAYEELPAATYMKENSETFGRWVEVIERADLYHTLNLYEIYTIFAPNNDAVDAYLQLKGLASVADMSKEDAAYLVKFHLLRSVAFDQSQFQNGAIPRSTETDDDLTIEFREGGLNAIYLNGEARFVQLDIEVTNGVIHEIDAVLVPITASVNDVLTESRYTIFHEAVFRTGYEEMLATIYEVDTSKEGYISSKRFQFTTFAVTDSIYGVNGINSFADLNTKLGTSGTDYTAEDNALFQYVSYHILGTSKSSADLSVFPTGETTTNINTLAKNQIMSVSNILGLLVINYDKVTEEGISILEENITCRNGVIHEVNDWMPLFTPEQVTVLWDLADQSDIASLCTKYQRSDLTGSYYNRTFEEGELTSYTWKSSPEGRSGVVAYRNNRNNDGIYYFTNNWDHMRFTTGASGWVETSTPVLIAGTYKITLHYVSRLSTANEGIMLTSLDGRQVGGQLVTSNTQTDQLMSHVLSEAFEFQETSAHTFRIVGIDGKLLMLDYISFEPVQ